MYAIYNGIRNTSRLSGVVARSYHRNITCTPPQVKISTPEKILCFGCIAGAILVWPMYFAPNFKRWSQSSSS
ncbi:hypothetical protein HN011_005385 [Eciton burchellii]|nr:hypothetical protein HN011_005385 [Eciton burchellii]